MAIVEPTASREKYRERIFHAVRDMYTDVGKNPSKTFHFPTGRWACEFLGYPADEIESIPETAVESFAGVGYPFKADIIRNGECVLDIGCGSGTDIFIAALKTGSSGKVYGLDMTETMIKKTRKNILKSGNRNIQVVKGNAESLPWSDGYFNVVTSNGVLNLVPEKKVAFNEIYRVLNDEGRIQITDIVLKSEISEKCRLNPELWAECIVGAVPEEQYIGMLRTAGFTDIQVIDRGDYFDRSPSEATRKSARQFGAISITVMAEK